MLNIIFSRIKLLSISKAEKKKIAIEKKLKELRSKIEDLEEVKKINKSRFKSGTIESGHIKLIKKRVAILEKYKSYINAYIAKETIREKKLKA